ncbi:Rnf-Nqr domain containing protein [Caproicibacter sp.]|uniref:Rnf-Nqr domain containing protein n=1 Tax=Caproicibacter sp. TaxID=2814884 RepID=UPI00398A1069
MFFRLMMTALLAVGTENLLFAGGSGFSRALRSAQRPDTVGIYALAVTWFSLASVFAGVWLAPFLPAAYGTKAPLRSACLAAAAAVAYLVTFLLLRALLPARFLSRIAPVLAPAAVNTVVLAMPYVQYQFALDPAQAAGYALGTGAAFYLASEVLMHAEAKCRNPDIPEAFSGLPASILFVGILSMAFAGFAGGKVF